MEPARIWTWNPLNRRQMPYPLGYRANYEWYKVSWTLLCLAGKFRKEILQKKLIDPARIWTWNPLIRSQMPYPLGHRANNEWIEVEMNVLTFIRESQQGNHGAKIKLSKPEFEPGIPWFVVRCLIYWATRPTTSGIKLSNIQEFSREFS